MILPPATAIVLAGGSSTRMGRDKALLEWKGAPLIAHVVAQLRPHFCEVLISVADARTQDLPQCRLILDEQPGQGPMMGLYSALRHSQQELNFAAACDIPELPLPLIAALFDALGDADCAAPTDAEGRIHPLFAVYRRSRMVPVFEALLAGEQRALRRAFSRCHAVYVPIPPGLLLNLNTPEDYRNLKDRPDMGHLEG